MTAASLHRYRSTTCGGLRSSNIGSVARLSGWVHRVRDHGGVLFIDLRDHHGLTQVVADPDSPAFKMAEKLRSRMGRARSTARSAGAPDGTDNSDLATGEIEVYATEIEVLSEAKELPVAGFRRAGLSGRFAPAVPLPGPAPRDAARHHHEAPRDYQVDAPPYARRGLQRVPDADPDGVLARRRARFPRALAHPSRQVLRAAAGPAAVQAAADGLRLRPLLPDRALLPRRGPARRPPAGRVLPARRGDELRRAGRHLPDDGADPHPHLRRVMQTASR